MKRPPGRPPLANRDQVLAIIRGMEQDSLRDLPAPEPHITHARSILPITRPIYACIERPPTRHQQFWIITQWRRNDMTAESHGVFVRRGRPYKPWYEQVIDNRPGAFGA